MRCTIEERDTGSKIKLSFRARCNGEKAGHIDIFRSNKKLRGKVVWTVSNVDVEPSLQRKGIATSLYEAAAQAVCQRRGSLASTERTPGAHSHNFWLKQERKGRAVRIRRPRAYPSDMDRERAANMYDAFLLDCDYASDLSGLNLNLKSPWIWGAAGVGVALLALTGKKGSPASTSTGASYSDWLVPSVTKISAPPVSIRNILSRASARYGVPLDILIGVAHTESRYNPLAQSPAGAAGLMQLMPITFQSLGVSDPWDPQQNADGGAKFLAALKRQYGTWEKALAAYNWGQGNVNHNPTPPQWPSATRTYVANVLRVASVV